MCNVINFILITCHFVVSYNYIIPFPLLMRYFRDNEALDVIDETRNR